MSEPKNLAAFDQIVRNQQARARKNSKAINKLAAELRRQREPKLTEPEPNQPKEANE